MVGTDDTLIADVSGGGDIHTDAALPDGGPSADGFVDGADAGDVEPGPYCPLPSAPTPDTACKVEGEMHCSDVGMYSFGPAGIGRKPEAPATIPDGFCVRPNRVICSKTNAGLRWVVAKCAMQPGPAKCKTGILPIMCQENSRGVSCCPYRCRGMSQPTGPDETSAVYGADWAREQEHGARMCYDNRSRMVVGYLDETPAIVHTNRYIMAKCAGVCKDCLYWFKEETCPVLTCPEKNAVPKPCPGGICHHPKFSAECKYKKPGEPYCQKTCAEVGAPGYE